MTTPEQLDERYGRTGGRRTKLVIIVSAAIALIAALAWIIIRSTGSSVAATDLGYEVVDQHSVTVKFQVTAPRDRALLCALEALDEEFGIVGWRIVEYPATSTHARAFSETIPTVSLATTGLVNTCWVE
ncbi:DUF4307 domain-containing protein [Microbacterium sp. YY-01]|uniref:DUF4307 domain-containing protein n=1 Tax=Microbacterium sp. YY-01 TaxID=3421634 RepID=UPI003D172E52